MADICTATVTVQYNKKDKKIGSVEIDKKEDFLKCVKGEVTSAAASEGETPVPDSKKVAGEEKIALEKEIEQLKLLKG